MKVIVVGAGEVGYHIADRLSREGHDVTVVEKSSEKEALIRDRLNALVVLGSGASSDVLEEVRVSEADLFIAVTDQDEVNIVSCMLANERGVPRMIARVKSLEFASTEWRSNAAKLGIDLLINPQTVVAEEIVNVVAYPAASSVAEFASGRVVFLGYPVERDSPLAGITLKELGALRGMYRMVVTAIRRGKDTVVPRGDDVIEEGNLIYFVCRKEDLAAVNYLFGFEKRTVESVFVLGGGRVGAAVVQRLAGRGARVRVIDRNPDHCRDLARQLDGVMVLNTDGMDLATLKSEGIEDADVFVAVTQDEQSNILCSLLAKSLGAKRGIALVNRPELVALAPTIGVNACVSPRLASASAILKFVRRGEVLSMAVLEECEAEVLELSLPKERPMLGKPLREIRVPMGSIVGAIIRGDDVIIPGGDDHFEAGDRVIVFALPEAVVRVEEFFA
jgi:trk system potassium uptake protein TrkA